MDKPKVNPQDYVWVITDMHEREETIVGLTKPDGGNFIPAAATREEAMAIMGQLPPGGSKERLVEAIHKKMLLDNAAKDGFEVLMVNGKGEILGPLQFPTVQ